MAAAEPGPSRFVTAIEHELLPVGGGPGSLAPSEADRLAALARKRPGFCTLGHRSVRLAQYAGLVNLGGRILEVLPKVGEQAEPGRARRTLLRLLAQAHDLPVFEHDDAGHDLRSHSLLDVFVLAYLRSLLPLVRAGLVRRYRSEEADIRVLRGRLLVSRQVAAHAMRIDTLACRFDELTPDNGWNQVLKAALAAVRPWIRGLGTGRLWLEMTAAFDEVSLPADALALHATLRRDRQVAHYEGALRWAGWILRLLSPGLRAGSSEAPELLFDMNRLFEAAVYGVLRGRATRLGLQLHAQHTGRHLASAFGEPAAGFFHLRPDLVLIEDDTVIAVGDTKWARLEMDSVGRLVPRNEHAYQMNAYAAAYPCEEVTLIYPWHDGLEGAHPTLYRLPPNGGREAILHIVGVDVGADGMPFRMVAGDSRLGRLL